MSHNRRESLHRTESADALTNLDGSMEQLKLTINETKTHIRELPQEQFDFLGYSFGRYYSPKTGRAHLCQQPS